MSKMIERIEAQTLAEEISRKIEVNKNESGFSLGNEEDGLIITVTDSKIESIILQVIDHKINYENIKNINIMKLISRSDTDTIDSILSFAKSLVENLESKLSDGIFNGWRYERLSLNVIHSTSQTHTIQINIYYVR